MCCTLISRRRSHFELAGRAGAARALAVGANDPASVGGSPALPPPTTQKTPCLAFSNFVLNAEVWLCLVVFGGVFACLLACVWLCLGATGSARRDRGDPEPPVVARLGLFSFGRSWLVSFLLYVLLPFLSRGYLAFGGLRLSLSRGGVRVLRLHVDAAGGARA
jgi:hypothetical protein